MGKDSDVPQPGPARLSKGAGPDEWLEQAKQCKYLPEAEMKRLCEIVKECLMEGEFLSKSPNMLRALPSMYPLVVGFSALTHLTRIQHPARPNTRDGVR